MERQGFFNRFVFLLILFFLYFFERVQMFVSDISEREVSFFQWLPLLIIVFALLFILTNKYYKKDSVGSSLFLLFSFLYLFSLLLGGFYTIGEYITVVLPVILFVFAYDAYIGEGDARLFNIFITIVFIALSIHFFNNIGINSFEELSVQIPGSYTLLYFLPFILCLPKMGYRMVGIFIIFVAILMSLKRGGTVALVASIFIYLLVYQYSYKKKKARFFTIFLAIVFLASLFFFYDYIEQATDGLISQRFESIASDEGSGRKEIYASVWRLIGDSSFDEFFLGHGWQGVSSKLGGSAHNDFLEVLYDFGIIVFILYLVFYWKLIVKCVRLLKERSFYAPPLIASVTLFFFNSLVSHIIIYPKYMMIMCLFWGMVSAATRNQQPLYQNK